MLDSNLFWTIIGVVGGGILSLIITLLVQRFSNRKFITFEITTWKYLSNDNSVAFFSSEGAFVDSMSISAVKISTRSSGLIRTKDFVPDQPLMLSDIDAPGKIYAIKQGGFFDIHRKYFDKAKPFTRSQLAIVHISKDKAILDFDYIEKKRPLEFLVFHDAKLRIEGKLIDGIIREKVRFINKIRDWKSFFYFLLLAFLPILLIVILPLIVGK